MTSAKTSDAPESIEARFVAAWAVIKNPDLDGENPHFHNTYATLKSTLGVIRDACKPFKIAYRQQLHRTEDGPFELRSSIISDAGDVMAISTFPVETPPNPQSFGSNMTYAKRQQAQADWCITGEVDDDGEAGAQEAKRAHYERQAANTYGRQNQAANARQNASNAKNNRKTNDEKRAEYIDRVLDLRAQVEAGGTDPASFDEFIEATFNGKAFEELNAIELTTLGKHLSSVLDGQRQLREERADA